PVTLSASATSGLPLSFTSDTPAVCTVSSSTVATMAAGMCTITAAQGGSADFAAASEVARSFHVNAGGKGQHIFFAQPPDVPVGTPVIAAASATSELPVSFTFNTPTVCTVSSHTVMTVAAGVYTITAAQSSSTDFAAAPQMAHSF